MNFNKKGHIFLLLIWILIATISAKTFTRIVSLSQNTLLNNGNWQVTKTGLYRRPMGAISFLVTTLPLADNNLNLAAWHGFQEVIYKEKIDPIKIKFDFFLKDKSELAFIFNKNSSGYSGIFLEKKSKGQNFFFNATSDGMFKAKVPLSISNIKRNEWNKAEINFSTDSTFIKINDAIAVKVTVNLLQKFYIGFKGGLSPTYVDNIEIEERGKGKLLSESFDGNNLKTQLFGLTLLCILALNIATFLFYKKSKKAFFTLFTINLFFLVFMFTLKIYLTLQAKKYPTDPNKVEWFGFTNEQKDPDLIRKTISEKHNINNKNKNHRILFIGTSQLWGEGATGEGKIAVHLVEQHLNKTKKIEKQFECINTGMPAYTSNMLLDLYKNEWIKYDPDMVVIILSNNDQFDVKLFYESIQEFILLNQKNNISTILVAEAMYKGVPGFLKNHMSLRFLSIKYNLPFINMDEYLKTHTNDGFLWWDNSHLTDFGQKLLAKKLYNELLTLIQSNIKI